MKLFSVKKLTAVLTVIMLCVISIAHFNAATLYYDGNYTYADTDQNSVALYAYEGESTVLIVPASYNGRYVTSLYNYAFEDNTSITSIDFSQASRLFSTIGMKSFSGCTSLTGELSLPSSVTSIGHAAFQGCSGITSLKLDSAVAVIPAQCFNRCSKLGEVRISPFTETIDNLAFANCPYLKDVYLQTAVTSISETAFLNSPNVCLCVYYGSYACDYAKEHSLRYRLIDGVKLGDVNDDGDVNINDVTYIQRFLTELESLEGIYLYAADTNRDTMVNISDATAVQMFLAEYDIPYSIGQVLTR